MVLKATTALLAFATLFAGAAASPVQIASGGPEEETFYVWSDTSRCDQANPLEVRLRDNTKKDAKGVVDQNQPDIVGQQLPSGEVLYTLKAPFDGSYVVSPKRGQTYAPPEVQIELFPKGQKPAGKATYKPGLIPAEFDRIGWTPDPNVKDQKVLKPSLDSEAQIGQAKQGKEDFITTDTFGDSLWFVWCSGEQGRLLETSLRTRLSEKPPTQNTGG
ncbi:uncharacterized protein J3D65DRAFT_603807 [Phyllosticta citribraziliensis]|uniref:Uncharacterized protein n=1 Tax=Phyllosticta citribraziliensis TaxID=989973 RepID=A0ABR1LNF1_9PEZI